MQSQVKHTTSILMFINSSSGGGVGKALVEQEIDSITFNLSGKIYDVYFINMRKNREEGFLLLKRESENKKTIGVICGGDGTVMWVVSEMAKYSINPMKVSLSIIPLGTGNDFSRNLGWGSQQKVLTQNSFEELKRLIREWTQAKEECLDIWQVEIGVNEHGRFEKVENGKDQVFGNKILLKHFVNYFSIGVDGEIGYEFDKRRTSTRIGNLAVYGAMGIKAGLTKVKNLGELIEVMYIGQKNQVLFEGNSKSLADYIGNPFSFNFGDLVQGVKKVNSFHSNQNLLALNINSYMGGSTDIWKKAKENQYIKLKQEPTEPSHSDGKIEFVSFSNSGKIGLQKALGALDIGFAERITQGSGPFCLKFKQYSKDSDHRTFVQIDGQFIKVVHPLWLGLRRSRIFAHSQIKVLHRRQ